MREGLLCTDTSLRRQGRGGHQGRKRGTQRGVGVPAPHHKFVVHVFGAVGGTGQPIAGGNPDNHHIVRHVIVRFGSRLRLVAKISVTVGTIARLQAGR